MWMSSAESLRPIDRDGRQLCSRIGPVDACEQVARVGEEVLAAVPADEQRRPIDPAHHLFGNAAEQSPSQPAAPVARHARDALIGFADDLQNGRGRVHIRV